MAVSIVGVLVNIVMVVIIIIILLFGYIRNAELKVCETQQSTYCFTILCPCDGPNDAPCFGYAKMPAEGGNFYCSSAPQSLVDAKGAPVNKSIFSL